MPFKKACRGWKRVQTSKASGKTPKISKIWHRKQRLIEICETPEMWNRSWKTKSKSPKYDHASVKAILTTKTENIIVSLDVKYMAT